MVPVADRTVLGRAFWTAVALAAVTAAAAIFAARDLVYDGSYYVLGIAVQRWFQLYEPARLVPELLQQGFAVAGAKLGIHDLWTLGVLFSLGCSGWPVVLTAACWFVLPRGQKSWIAGPLLNLVFAIPATSFIGIGEGIIASCLLWHAFLLIEFRSANAIGALACVVVTAAAALSHEAAALCLVVIAGAALLRLSDTNGICRAAMLVAALIALAGAADMARWILFPRSTVERGDFLVSMLGGFLGSPTAPNIPALASVVAAVACLAAWFFRGKWERSAAIAAIAIFAVLLAALIMVPGDVIAPSRFFAARGLPVALTTLLAALFLFLRRRGVAPARFVTGTVLAIVLALALVQAAMQLVITEQWAGYIAGLRGLARGEAGIVSHDRAMRVIDPQGARFRRELLESWSVEPLAIVLAPEGHVRAFVAAAPGARWVPYDPDKPSTLPHVPGLDWSGFVPRTAP